MQSIQFTAKCIKDLCDEKGLSINKMLTESGAGARTYHNMLAGSFPSIDKITKIAEYFNVSVDYLLGKEEKPVTSDELTENLIIYHRNGKTVKKQFTKEQMEQLMRDIDALESTVDEDL